MAGQMKEEAFLAAMFEGQDLNYTPKKFNYDKESWDVEISVYIDLSDKKDAKRVLDMMKENLDQQFCRCGGAKSFASEKLSYVCHLSDRKKGATHSKKTGCNATLHLTFFDRTKAATTKGTKGSEARKAPRDCLVTLKACHNHTLYSAQHKRLMRSPESLRQTIVGYFARGQSAAEALRSNEERLREDGDFTVEWLSDALRHPNARTVYYWYVNWRQDTYGGRSDWDVKQELLTRQANIRMDGGELEIANNGLEYAYLSPLMLRVHQKHYAGLQLFMDSTSAVDQTGATVTLLQVLEPETRMTLPLGVLVTEGTSQEAYTQGLDLLNDGLNRHIRNARYKAVKWGGRGDKGPEFIMLDNSEPEIKAAKATWKNVIVELCTFHSLKAGWRNINADKTKLTQAEKLVMYKEFKSIVMERDKTKFNVAWSSFLDELVKAGFGELHDYLQRVYVGHEQKWAVAFRSCRTRMSDTNNVSERLVLTIKDEVLKRLRAFNSVALLDYFEDKIDEVYESRILRFCYGRDRKREDQLELPWKQARKFPNNSSSQLNGNGPDIYEVKSASTPGKLYQVNTRLGKCNCYIGYRGYNCAHMSVVAREQNISFPGLFVKDSAKRLELALVASGAQGGHKAAHFASLRPVAPPQGANIGKVSEDVPVDEMDLLDDDLDELITGIDPASNTPAPPQPLSQADKNLVNGKAVMIHRLVESLGQKAVQSHGAAAFSSAADSLIGQLSKLSTGGQFMAFLNRQTGVVKAGKKRRIGVNNSAVMRRKNGNSSRNPAKNGRPKRQHNVPVGPAALAKRPNKHKAQLSPQKNSQRQPQAKAQRSRSRTPSLSRSQSRG